jgi:phosphoglycolate phosphatase-like HAD superfamily hydrolase
MSVDVAHAVAAGRRHDWQPSGGSLPNPLDPGLPIRAVLFDLDGTLYRQAPLRALMALELFALPLLFNPTRAPRHWVRTGGRRNSCERTSPGAARPSAGRSSLPRAGARTSRWPSWRTW